MQRQLVATEDGSLSIRDEATGELQHNRAGAYAEALVNYVQPAGVLSAAASRMHAGDLRILDVCFGLGYNSLVLLSEIVDKKLDYQSINILGIEKDAEIVSLIPAVLRYEKFRPLTELVDFSKIAEFRAESFSVGKIAVTLQVVQDDIRNIIPMLANLGQNECGANTACKAISGIRDWDLVFHDPFSAKHVPELWTVDFFRCYHHLLQVRAGRVLTYSSAAAVRGGLRAAGFNVFRSQALGGKSGGTVGSIDERQREFGSHYLLPLEEDENLRLSTASGIPYRDETFAAPSADIRARRLVEQFEFNQSRKQK